MIESAPVLLPCSSRCPVCATACVEDARSSSSSSSSVRCPRCDTPHHPECWDYLGGCAVFACSPSGTEERRSPFCLSDLQEWRTAVRSAAVAYALVGLSLPVALFAPCLHFAVLPLAGLGPTPWTRMREGMGATVVGGLAALVFFGWYLYGLRKASRLERAFPCKLPPRALDGLGPERPSRFGGWLAILAVLGTSLSLGASALLLLVFLVGASLVGPGRLMAFFALSLQVPAAALLLSSVVLEKAARALNDSDPTAGLPEPGDEAQREAAAIDRRARGLALAAAGALPVVVAFLAELVAPGMGSADIVTILVRFVAPWTLGLSIPAGLAVSLYGGLDRRPASRAAGVDRLLILAGAVAVVLGCLRLADPSREYGWAGLIAVPAGLACLAAVRYGSLARRLRGKPPVVLDRLQAGKTGRP